MFYQAAVKNIPWIGAGVRTPRCDYCQLCNYVVETGVGSKLWLLVFSKRQNRAVFAFVCFFFFLLKHTFVCVKCRFHLAQKKKKKKQVICMHLKFPSRVKMVTDVKRWHFWQEQMLGKCLVFISSCENTGGKFALRRWLCKKHDTTWLRALHSIVCLSVL